MIRSDARGAPTRVRLARGAVVVIAAEQALIGIWGLAAPHSFYRSFPGAGHHWVAALGPYNEHLVRDFAALELGLAVLLVGAAVWFERRLMRVAGAAFVTAQLPHFAYHLTTTGAFAAADNIASLSGFAIQFALVGAAMLSVRATPPSPKGTL